MATTYQINAAGTTAGEDQTAQQQKGGTVELNPAETLLTRSAESDKEFLALRWVSVAIPAKAKILSAKLELWVPSGAGTTNNKAEKAEAFIFKEPKGCAVFKAEAKNLSSRSNIKKAIVLAASYTAGAWAVIEPAALKEALGTLVGEAGWESGNAVGLYIEALVATKLAVENYPSTHEHGAKLVIEYEGEGGAKHVEVTAVLADKATLTGAAVRGAKAVGSLTDHAALTAVGVRGAWVSGALSDHALLTGSGVKAAGASGLLRADAVLTANARYVGSATARLTATAALLGLAGRAFTVTGLLADHSALAGVAVKAATATGALSDRATLTSAAVKAAGVSATLSERGSLAGASNAKFVITGRLSEQALFYGSASSQTRPVFGEPTPGYARSDDTGMASTQYREPAPGYARSSDTGGPPNSTTGESPE